jgi:hypothetical protein
MRDGVCLHVSMTFSFCSAPEDGDQSGPWAAAPVTVTTAITSDPVPGATVTAKATVAITDGSSLVNIKWTQNGGPAATLSNTSTDTVTVALPNRKVFREALLTALEESPIADSQYPANIPVTPFEGGLQNRFTVASVSPHALADSPAGSDPRLPTPDTRRVALPGTPAA